MIDLSRTYISHTSSMQAVIDSTKCASYSYSAFPHPLKRHGNLSKFLSLYEDWTYSRAIHNILLFKKLNLRAHSVQVRRLCYGIDSIKSLWRAFLGQRPFQSNVLGESVLFSRRPTCPKERICLVGGIRDDFLPCLVASCLVCLQASLITTNCYVCLS